MPNPSIPCTGSPDITTLSYSILYDISGGIPAITLTNASTVIHANNLIWWYVITSPSGTPIHSGSVTSPDVNMMPWTTLSIAPNTWPLLFGNPPCAQVEFSSNAPYLCTLYVKDSASNIFSLPIIQTITRPNGNTTNSCGNFGAAQVVATVNCNGKNILCVDSTNFAYNNILLPTASSNEWILVYPSDANGNQPANGVATNTPNVNFPIGYSGDGYVFYLLDYAAYDMGNGATIKVQYKAINPATGSPGLTFAVLCNINLCKLQCQIQAFYELSKQKCNTVENTTLESKMTRINFLFNQAIIGILQPLCGIDVPKIVLEIQKTGNLDPNCNCGCTDNGINFSYPIGGNTSGGGCCPVSSNVVISGTNTAPAGCPGNYFPVKVLDPTDTTIIGVANNINDMVALLNSTPAWEAYGVAFPEGYCKVGWFPASGVVNVPVIPVILGGGTIIPTTTVVGSLVILDTVSPPAGCPGIGPYPVRVYDPTGMTIIGIANNINDVCTLLNTYPTWEAYGIASPQDNCHVQWQLTNSTVIPPDIQVDTNTTSSTCTNGSVIYTVIVSSICGSGALMLSDFPLNAYVDFGLGAGPVFLGNIANMSALIAALNATPTKPASVTFSAGSVFGQVVATNTNCIAYNGTVAISGNLGAENFMLYGGNHSKMISSPAPLAAEQGIGLATSSLVGVIPGITLDKPIWHTITIANYLIFTVQNTVSNQVMVYDITNPLAPVFVRGITLNDTGGSGGHACFTGLPNSVTVSSGVTAISSIYGLCFPTDNPSAMTPGVFYVSEPVSGSIWQLNIFDTSISSNSGVTASFTNAKLLGKCPRVFNGGNIYFTQDGDLETAAGLTSTIPIGNVVVLSLATFSGVGLSQFVVIPNQVEYVWAASFDGNRTIYYLGQRGTLATYDVPTATVTNRYANAFSTAQYRLNIKYALNFIFASSYTFTGKTTGTQRIITTALPTISRIDFANFTPPGGTVANNATHYNPLPLGNCLVLVTYDNWADSGHSQGGIAIFNVNGTFYGVIQLVAGDIYNVVAIPNVSVYSPTTLV